MMLRAAVRMVAIACVAGLAFVACGKTKQQAPYGERSCKEVECVVAVSCRKNDCNGEQFWNDCCPCPEHSVSSFTCDGGALP